MKKGVILMIRSCLTEMRIVMTMGLSGQDSVLVRESPKDPALEVGRNSSSRGLSLIFVVRCSVLDINIIGQ